MLDCLASFFILDLDKAFWTASARPGGSGTPAYIKIAPQFMNMKLLLRMRKAVYIMDASS